MEHTSRYYHPTDPVSVIPLGTYSPTEAEEALRRLLAPIGGLSFVKEGMKVVIKANLVSAMKPDAAATTHPVLLSALCRLLKERGASVVIGDSPGGLYTPAFVGHVYKVSGMTEVTDAELNRDFSEKATEYPEGRVLRSFTYTGYLDKADLIINFCKLKSHGMMSMSCAAKNMFGTIPGIIKPEYHYRFPRHEDFADMLLDLDEYFHPVLSIADAVIGMEGNGPTAGTPKKIGCLIASPSPHTLDMVAAHLLGFTPEEIPTLAAAARRGLLPERVEDVALYGDLSSLVVTDFERVVERRSLRFTGDGKNPIKRFFGGIAERILRTKPVVKTGMCVGCGVCRDICPAKTIVIENKKAKIKRDACIRCFCCQEFCPKSAIKVHRTALAALFHHEKKKK
ncbi:MAG: DUF362 domain-containing protein [Clostridia bacterium]|nr:DUF362 domain-containing protein [Clostridia bacterium]